jgi:hypothetical protein
MGSTEKLRDSEDYITNVDSVSFEIRQQDEGQGTKDSHDAQLSGSMESLEIRVRVDVSIPVESGIGVFSLWEVLEFSSFDCDILSRTSPVP